MHDPEYILIKVHRHPSYAQAIAKELIFTHAMTIGWNKCERETLPCASVLLDQLTAPRSEEDCMSETVL